MTQLKWRNVILNLFWDKNPCRQHNISFLIWSTYSTHSANFVEKNTWNCLHERLMYQFHASTYDWLIWNRQTKFNLFWTWTWKFATKNLKKNYFETLTWFFGCSLFSWYNTSWITFVLFWEMLKLNEWIGACTKFITEVF